MIRYVKDANLPKGRVKSIICGELCKELNEYFDNLGIERIVIEPNTQIDDAVKFHADMASIHLGENKILIDINQNKLSSVLKTKGFNVISTGNEIKGEYPCDISLNFTIVRNNIIGKIDFADKKLLELTDTFKCINVKQGYCKCSCLVVNNNAIITDDESIYKSLISNEFDALLISKGDTLLPGHEYGFIGGASGKICEDEVLFFGNITQHRDYKKISDFSEKHDCKIAYLDFPLTDFGGIIPLTEEV